MGPAGGSEYFDNDNVLDGSSNTALQNTYRDFSSVLSGVEKKAQNGDPSALEHLFNYYASEASAKSARDWTAAREDTQYQRLMADLQKAGISPYILTGATPGVSSATGVSHSGSSITSYANSKRTQETANRDRAWAISKEVLGLIGTALMALMIFV